MESSISFEIPNARELATLNLEDYTKLLRNNADTHFQISSSSESFGSSDHPYLGHTSSSTIHQHRMSASGAGEMPADYSLVVVSIWIIVIFGFFAVTIVFCVFSCMFYSKIRRWNQAAANFRHAHDACDGEHQCDHHDDDVLPSYTLVSGLPSYEDVMKQPPPSYAADIRRYPQHYIHIGYFAADQKDPQQCVSIVNNSSSINPINDINNPNTNTNNQRPSAVQQIIIPQVVYENESTDRNRSKQSPVHLSAIKVSPSVAVAQALREGSNIDRSTSQPKVCRQTSKSSIIGSTTTTTTTTTNTASLSSSSFTTKGTPDVATMS